MLDNVIDLNFYPHAKVKHTNLKSRAIGCSIMVKRKMLADNTLHGTASTSSKIDEVMEAISYNAIVSLILLLKKALILNFQAKMK